MSMCTVPSLQVLAMQTLVEPREPSILSMPKTGYPMLTSEFTSFIASETQKQIGRDKLIDSGLPCRIKALSFVIDESKRFTRPDQHELTWCYVGEQVFDVIVFPERYHPHIRHQRFAVPLVHSDDNDARETCKLLTFHEFPMVTHPVFEGFCNTTIDTNPEACTLQSIDCVTAKVRRERSNGAIISIVSVIDEHACWCGEHEHEHDQRKQTACPSLILTDINANANANADANADAHAF